MAGNLSALVVVTRDGSSVFLTVSMHLAVFTEARAGTHLHSIDVCVSLQRQPIKVTHSRGHALLHSCKPVFHSSHLTIDAGLDGIRSATKPEAAHLPETRVKAWHSELGHLHHMTLGLLLSLIRFSALPVGTFDELALAILTDLFGALRARVLMQFTVIAHLRGVGTGTTAGEDVTVDFVHKTRNWHGLDEAKWLEPLLLDGHGATDVNESSELHFYAIK